MTAASKLVRGRGSRRPFFASTAEKIRVCFAGRFPMIRRFDQLSNAKVTLQMAIELSAEVRLCRRCYQSKPLTEFRRRSPNRDARFHECRGCHAVAERHRRQAARSQTDREIVAKTVQAIARDRNFHRIEYLVQRAADACGGFDRLAAEFHRQIEAAGRKLGVASSMLAMTGRSPI